MAVKLTRLIHKIAIQLYLAAESCTIFSSRARRPVRKLLDTSSCFQLERIAVLSGNFFDACAWQVSLYGQAADIPWKRCFRLDRST